MPASIDHRKVKSIKTKDLWLVYPVVIDFNVLVSTLCALYYLPENYKLLVVADEASQAMLAFPGHESLMKRVRFEPNMESLHKKIQDLPAKTIIYDHAGGASNKIKIKAQAVILINDMDKDPNHDANGYTTVSANRPEALASAILRMR